MVPFPFTVQIMYSCVIDKSFIFSLSLLLISYHWLLTTYEIMVTRFTNLSTPFSDISYSVEKRYSFKCFKCRCPHKPADCPFSAGKVRLGNGISHTDRRKQIIRTHLLSETSSDYIGLVPLTGIEPVRCCHRGILSPLRLPIPPQRHS